MDTSDFYTTRGYRVYLQIMNKPQETKKHSVVRDLIDKFFRIQNSHILFFILVLIVLRSHRYLRKLETFSQVSRIPLSRSLSLSFFLSPLRT